MITSLYSLSTNYMLLFLYAGPYNDERPIVASLDKVFAMINF